MGFGDMTRDMGKNRTRGMLFAGQQRTKPVLTIELVPKTTWFKNVRKLASKEAWDTIRKGAYKKARYKCEICGGRGPKWPVECHERWRFDARALEQVLQGFIALCPDCHAVKHWGYHAHVLGKEQECRDHLVFVNGWTNPEVDAHVAEAMATWEQRSRQRWNVDLSVLRHYGVTVPKPRRVAAGAALIVQDDEECPYEEEPMEDCEDLPEGYL